MDGVGVFDGRLARRIGWMAALAVLLAAVIAAPPGASAQTAVDAESGEAADGGYEPCFRVGTNAICWGSGGDPDRTGSGQFNAWRFYCQSGGGGRAAVNFGDYPPSLDGLTEDQLNPEGRYVRWTTFQPQLDAFWIERYGLNPTGTYKTYFIDCWDVDIPGWADSKRYFDPAEAIWRVAGVPDPAAWIAQITPPIDPTTWLSQVAAGLPALPPPAATAPDPGLQAVNVASWVWLTDPSYAPIEGRDLSETRGVATLTVTATPTGMSFDPGSGDGPVSCPVDSPAWSPGSDQAAGCTYTYGIPSIAVPGGVFSAQVAVDWDYTWTLRTPERIFVLDELFFTTSAFTAFGTTVDELQILETE
jgi:hypothetical protein